MRRDRRDVTESTNYKTWVVVGSTRRGSLEARHSVGPPLKRQIISPALGKKLGKTLQIVDIAPADYVATLLKAGMPSEWANVDAEMYNGFGSGKLRPVGDRLVEGKTTLDTTLAERYAWRNAARPRGDDRLIRQRAALALPSCQARRLKAVLG